MSPINLKFLRLPNFEKIVSTRKTDGQRDGVSDTSVGYTVYTISFTAGPPDGAQPRRGSLLAITAKTEAYNVCNFGDI